MKIDTWFPDNTEQTCGGSLLDPGRVLTTAGCFFSVSGGEKFVKARLTLGAHNVEDPTGDEKVIDATPADVIIHPDYHSPGLQSNNIAIILILHPEDLTIVPLEECRNSYSVTKFSDSIDDKVICAGIGDRIGDTCKGMKRYGIVDLI